MDLDQARDIIRGQHHAVLATMLLDGTPQMSPVLAAVDEAGHVLVSTRETAYKVRQLRQNPRVWLCVLPDQFFGPWIQIDGTVEIVPLPEAMDGLVGYYRQISGEQGNWDEYRAAMTAERRVLLRVELHRAGPDHSG